MLIGLVLVIVGVAGGVGYVLLNRPRADVAGNALPESAYSAEEIELQAVVRPRETPAPRQAVSLPSTVATPSKPLPPAAATATPQPTPSPSPPNFFAPPLTPSATAVAAAASATPRTPTATATGTKVKLDQSFFGVESIAVPSEVRAHFAPSGKQVRELCGFFRLGDEYHVYYDAVLRSPANTIEWGHAVSRDMFSWTEATPMTTPVDAKLKPVLGSVIVDAENASGLGKESVPPWIAAYTYASSGDTAKGIDFGLAVSTDLGKTWTTVKDQPILKAKEASARRLRLFYDAASKQWCLCWLIKTVVPPAPSSKAKPPPPAEPPKTTYRLFSSPDLKAWKQIKEFEFNDGAAPATLAAVKDVADPTKTQWLFLTGRGRYWLTEFDGADFTTERLGGPLQSPGGYHGLIPLDAGGKPTNELVLLSLLTSAATSGGATEAAAFAFPRRLKLQAGGVLPSRDSLPSAWLGAAQPLPHAELLADAPLKVLDGGRQFRLQLQAEPEPTAVLQVTIFGVPIKFNLPSKTLQIGTRTPTPFAASQVQIDGSVDDHLVELTIGGVGLVGFDAPTGPDTNTPLELRCSGGKTRLASLTVTPLKPPKPAAVAPSSK